jgi:LysR family transcriptional regulator, low CO2-responsive transcriptional regulator
MNWSLDSLAVFDAVSRHGSVTRGAAELSMSQPNVTREIKNLERAMGARLLERFGRGIRLTQAGDILAQYAAKILRLAGEADDAIGDLHQLTGGKIIVGAGATIGMYLLPAVLVRFKQQFSKIDVRLEIGNSALLRDRLRDGRIDFALTESAINSAQHHVELFMSDELVAIVPLGHPLANRRSVRLESLAKERFVIREPGSETQSLVERVFADKRLKIQPVMALGSTEAVKRAVVSGLGISIVSKMCVEAERKLGELAVVPLQNLSMRRPVFLVRRKGQHETKAAAEFLKVLTEFIQTKGH